MIQIKKLVAVMVNKMILNPMFITPTRFVTLKIPSIIQPRAVAMGPIKKELLFVATIKFNFYPPAVTNFRNRVVTTL